MKKTFTKRVLSIVLAMLMVITALPFTALTASAAATNIASQATKTDYIPGTSTKTYDNNFSNGTNISDGRYGYDNNNASNISGGINNTNSWNYNYGKSGSSYDNAYVNYTWSEEKSISEIKVYFWVDSGATKMPNSFKIRYSNDGSNYEELTFSNHSSSSNSNCGIGNYKTLSEKNTLPNTGDILTVVCSTFDLSTITSPIKYLQLVSTRQGTNCVGLSEIEIFGETYVAPPVDPAQQAKELKYAMTAFENKMNSTSLQTNVFNAYNAYVSASKAYDAYVYGGQDIDLSTYTSNLNNAVSQMNSVTISPSTSASGKFQTDTADSNKSNFKNALFIDTASSTNGATEVSSISPNHGTFKLYFHKGIYLYDGSSNIEFPVMMTLKHNQNYFTMYSAYLSGMDNGVKFKNNLWYGTDGPSDDMNFNKYTSPTGDYLNRQYKFSTFEAFSSDGSSTASLTDKKNWSLYNVNSIAIDGSKLFSDNSAYKYANMGNINYVSYHTAGVSYTSSSLWRNSSEIAKNNVLVINYKQFKDYVDKYVALQKNVANYKENGFYNAAYALNGSNLNFNISSFADGEQLAKDISTNIDSYKNYAETSTTVDSTGYPALRFAMNETVRTTFNGGVNDEGYTETSWNNFVTAYNNAKAVMATVNSQGYNKASNAGSYATALTAAYNALKLNITVKFVNAAGTTISTNVYEEGTSASAIKVPISNTTNKIETTQHTIYSWPTIKDLTKANYNNFADTTVTINEISNQGDHDYDKTEVSPATCTNVQRLKYTCKVCEFYFETNGLGIAADNHTWDAGTRVEKTHKRAGYTHYVCTENRAHTKDEPDEDTSLADTSAYNAAVAKAQAIIAQPNKYSEATITALTEALEDNALDDVNGNTQTEINVKTTDIASVEITLKSFTVNINYVDDEGDSIASEKPQTVEYGNDITLTVPEKYSVIKWVRNIVVDGEGKDLKVAETSQSITVTVTADVTYYVTVNDLTTGSDAQNTVPVKLTNRIGKLVDAVYIPSGEYDVTVSDNTLCIGTDYKLVAPSIVFYDFGEFRINGKPVNDGKMTFDEDTVISTVYNPTTSNIKINCDSTCTANVANAYWDQKVVVTAVDGNANTKWIVNDKVVAYGPTYTFRASKTVNITCTTAQAVPTAAATVLNLGYGSIREKTISAVCSYYLPDGYKFKEAGVLLKTSAVNGNEAVSNDANYNLVSGNAKKFVASNFVTDTNQYVINVSSSKSYDSLFVGAVAFVTVTDMDGNNEQTFYSSLVTSDYEN